MAIVLLIIVFSLFSSLCAWRCVSDRCERPMPGRSSIVCLAALCGFVLLATLAHARPMCSSFTDCARYYFLLSRGLRRRGVVKRTLSDSMNPVAVALAAPVAFRSCCPSRVFFLEFMRPDGRGCPPAAHSSLIAHVPLMSPSPQSPLPLGPSSFVFCVV